MNLRTLTILGTLIVMGGCVERTLTLDSTPRGSLVYLNGEEVGRTPLTTPFTWYGNYDVVVRKEGYQTIKTVTKVKAPWWQWIPIDFVAELFPLPLKDQHHFSYSLIPASTQPAATQPMLENAAQLQKQLESSPSTRKPAP